MSKRLSTVEQVDDANGKGIEHPKHTSEKRVNNLILIHLEIKDPLVTKQGVWDYRLKCLN